MKSHNKVIKFFFSFVATQFITPTIVSCSSNKENDILFDKDLKSHFVDWYESLSKDSFSKNNYYCNSEQQAIWLYANKRGYFWNEFLHKQQEPQNALINNKEIRGKDYSYIDQALLKANFPYVYKVYHGVEYQEIEFYNQLQQFIKQKDDGSYDYSNCIGKTIESYGFISTSISRKEALEYCDGYIFNDLSKPWGDGKYFLPLREKVLFEITIPKGYIGAAYLADFKFNNEANFDKQVLIKRNCKFTINNIYKEKDVNIFNVLLVV